MRKLLAIAVLAAIAAAGSAFAADTPQQAAMKGCAAKWKTVSAADKAKTKYTDYMGTCMKAPATVAAAPAPAMAMKPTGAMAMKPAGAMAMSAKPAGGSMKPAAAMGGGQAKCKDGTTVTYKSRQGTCSGHKGVATWL